MKAMQLAAPRTALAPVELPVPRPGRGQLLIKVRACGVCRTDLHIVDGELAEAKRPIIPGHEIVGTVAEIGAGVEHVAVGSRVGVPWLGSTCGRCRYCAAGRENLCDAARFTGYHIVAQVARYQGRRLFAFSRPGDSAAQRFARELGADWAGDSTAAPPEALDAAIIFAPVGSLIPAALRATAKGGTVVCAGIHMSEIPAFPYDLLWGERVVRSVANLTRRDGEEFLALAPRVPVKTTTEVLKLDQANEALARLRDGRITGAAVLVP